MQLDAVTGKAEAAESSPPRRSLITRWAARFRLALSRTRPYILTAGAIYVGAFLLTIILRAGVVLPEDRWLLRQPIIEQPVNLDVGLAEWVYVFQHNLVADVLGIATAGVPGILVNAYGLGESAASAHAAGWAGTFWSLILPHGLLEIVTHSVALGVGLRFGRSLPARMRHRVARHGGIRAALADGFVLLLGLVMPATAVAALIEVELSTMWMPLPFAVLFGVFAGGTLVALILGIQGPEPDTVAAERRGTIEEQDPAPVVDGWGGRPIPEEDIARGSERAPRCRRGRGGP